MDYFDVAIGNTNKFEHLELRFNQYENLVSDTKNWVSNDSERYGYIKFSNRLIDLIKWIDDKVIVLHFNDVEEIAKQIREKKNG